MAHYEPPGHIVIEGPIRVGKTTLARLLADRLRARTLLDSEENPFLGDFYQERPGAAFKAQMWFLAQRFPPTARSRTGESTRHLGVRLSVREGQNLRLHQSQ